MEFSMTEPERRRGRPPIPREQLLDTALRLFQRQGFHAVGIDRILAEAGVAKMTLYKQFGSKQALIVAALERKNAQFFAKLREQLAAIEDRRERLLAVFDVFAGWFAEPDFHGCLFVKAAGEYPELSDPIHAAAADYKRQLLAELTELARSAGAPSARLLAQRLLLLLEGATALAQVLGGQEAARQARDTAALLLRQMLPQEAAQAA
jgi:AcrR family transcriptional regulator